MLRALVISSLLAHAALTAAEGTVSPLSSESPFMPGPEAGRSAQAQAGQGKYQLAGITVLGSETLITIVDSEQKKQRTLAVGAKAGNIEVVRCDAELGVAVIKVGGETQTISLRKAASKGGGKSVEIGNITPPEIPNVGPAGGALPPVKPLVTKEEQEREARMLVSDLLEIGMRQRKAYEEAQRKQAAEQGKK